MDYVISFDSSKNMREIIVTESNVFWGKAKEHNLIYKNDIFDLFNDDKKTIIDNAICWSPQNFIHMMNEINYWKISSIPSEYIEFVTSLKTIEDVNECLTVFDSCDDDFYYDRIVVDMLYAQLAYLNNMEGNNFDNVLSSLNFIMTEIKYDFVLETAIKHNSIQLFNLICPQYFSNSLHHKIPSIIIHFIQNSGIISKFIIENSTYKNIEIYVHKLAIYHKSEPFINYLLENENCFTFADVIKSISDKIKQSEFIAQYRDTFINMLDHYAYNPSVNHVELAFNLQLSYDDLLSSSTYKNIDFPNYINQILPIYLFYLHDSLTQIKILLKHSVTTLTTSKFLITKDVLVNFLDYECENQWETEKLIIILLYGLKIRIIDARRMFNPEVTLVYFKNSLVSDDADNSLKTIKKFIVDNYDCIV